MCRTEMDPECIELCKTLNQITGIKTRSSCCGHGEVPYWILFDLNMNEDSIAQILWILNLIMIKESINENGEKVNRSDKDWHIRLKSVLDQKPQFQYELLGPIGEKAYKEALEISDKINELMFRKNE